MLIFTDKAREKVLSFLKASAPGSALRIVCTPKGEVFSYQFGLEDYAAERPSDIIFREGGFATRLDPESAKYLAGATVDWTEGQKGAGFSVVNPNKATFSGDDVALKGEVLKAIQTIYDPEIPMVNIHDLGLIYEIQIDPARFVTVKMTLTAANCPAAEQLPVEVHTKVKAVVGVKDAKVDLVFEPPWDKDMMSESAKLALNLY